MNFYFLAVLCVYLILLFGIALWSQSRVKTEEDFLVGGRQFNLWLTSFCLFATWFGAGTLIASTDEVAKTGLRVTALEPFGAGYCLIFAGFFIAKPLWEMQITTYSDFFKQKFGRRAELLSVFLNIPIYVGWIAVQYIVLAKILNLFFPVPLWILILIICGVTLTLSLLGGIWSVSLTDSFQMLLIVLGLIYLILKVLSLSPFDAGTLLSLVPESRMVLIPRDKAVEFFGWMSLFGISALGNLTGQDLAQRIFAARSASVAQKGCLMAGVAYILIGCIPVFLGLTSSITLGAQTGPIIPMLIQRFLDPISGAILSVTILSAVVSTTTSALLAPSSLLSHNFLVEKFPHISKLRISRLSVVLIALLSLMTAYAGEDVYSLLESSYAIGFVAFFVPVVIGLFTKHSDELVCLITMALSTAFWSLEFFIGGDFPYALVAAFLGFPLYYILYGLKKTSLFKLKTDT